MCFNPGNPNATHGRKMERELRVIYSPFLSFLVFLVGYMYVCAYNHVPCHSLGYDLWVLPPILVGHKVFLYPKNAMHARVATFPYTRRDTGLVYSRINKIVTHGQTRQGTTRGGCDPWEVTSEHSPPYERLPPAVYETACMRLQVVKVLTEPIETHVIPST